MSENAYKQAGVDVEAGYESVRLIKDDVKKTAIEGVLGGIGGFGGLFEMPKNYENPVLVSGTDGVGTKIRVAFLMDKHDTIGQDCVAMCVTTLLVRVQSRCSSLTISQSVRMFRKRLHKSLKVLQTAVFCRVARLQAVKQRNIRE